jgi:predicted NBD/HSP70 family sugar kinase
MDTVSGALARLATSPRAEKWTLHLHSGFSGAATVRSYVLFAPPTLDAARAVLARLHNSVLLLAPAAAAVEGPLSEERLAPLLNPLRAVHKVPIGVGEVPAPIYTSTLPPGDGLACGLDIGGTAMKACAMRGRLVVRTATAPTWPDGADGVDSLVERARALVVQVCEAEPIGSLGIGLAAPMAVGGRVVDLSTVLRQKVGDARAFDGFAERVAAGLVHGPVAMFNDLANLGRYLSAEGLRRAVRVQIGTSFGGCWIDANGDVSAVEMGRLVVDLGPDAIPHPYLPLTGAMRGYLSNAGVGRFLEPRVGHPVDPRTAGHLLRGLLDAGDPAGEQALRWMADTLVGVVDELHGILPGVTKIEVGGSMLQGPAGRRLEALTQGVTSVPLGVSAKPGHDGAVAAAWAPRVAASLKGLKRVG